MTILVIGRQGQLATSLARLGTSSDLVTLGRPQLDLRSPGNIDPVLDAVKPNIIINAAGFTAVDDAERHAKQAFALNADAVGHLAVACARRGLPLVHISTDYVFDGRKSTPYVETDAATPINTYGRSKLEGELRLKAVHPQHIIVRTAWVYSTFGKNFLTTILQLARQRDEVRVVNDQWGNPTSASDLALLLLRIASRIRDGNYDCWGTYHVAGTGEATWFDFATHIVECTRELGIDLGRVLPIPSTEFPTAAARPKNSRLDSSLMKHTFHLSLPDWRESSRLCVASLMKQ